MEKDDDDDDDDDDSSPIPKTRYLITTLQQRPEKPFKRIYEMYLRLQITFNRTSI